MMDSRKFVFSLRVKCAHKCLTSLSKHRFSPVLFPPVAVAICGAFLMAPSAENVQFRALTQSVLSLNMGPDANTTLSQ